MFETVINLKPEKDWRPGVTIDRLIQEMDKALQSPGASNAWTMPIKARIDMLATGIRTPVGVKTTRRFRDHVTRGHFGPSSNPMPKLILCIYIN